MTLSLTPSHSPPRVRLVDAGVEMEAPGNLIYSTRPLSSHGDDGHEYVVKVAEPGAIAAEAVGYLLAQATGVPVPPFAIATTPEGHLAFASRKQIMAFRDCTPWVRDCRPSIADIFVLDIWLLNNDRNLGGLLADATGAGIRIIAIDFERSWAVRDPHPLIRSASIPPKTLWPRGDIGTMMQGAPFPATAIKRCQGVSDSMLRTIVQDVHGIIPEFDWHDSVIACLCRRRDKLDTLVREVWP